MRVRLALTAAALLVVPMWTTPAFAADPIPAAAPAGDADKAAAAALEHTESSRLDLLALASRTH